MTVSRTRASLRRRLAAPGAALFAATLAVAGFAAAGDTPPDAAPDAPVASGAATADRPTAPATVAALIRGVVKVETRAVPNARSAASLGMTREGSGIVIDGDGLVLTIGYLIVEADEVSLVDSRGRNLPARVVAYDHASGLGLVRAVVPLDVAPLAFGDSGKLGESDPVLVVNHDGGDDLTLARVVSKRPFTASWEYQLDQAIFTSPPTMNWSGAALVDRDLRLVGVGSLIVQEAAGDDTPLPGNMFVPIDALKPILADLVRTGRRKGPPRPWLGVAADEVSGRLVVSRVSPEGPADRAGMHAGDIILGVGGTGVRTQEEFYRKVWGRGAAGAEIRLRVLQGIDIHELTVRSIDRVEYFRPRTMY